MQNKIINANARYVIRQDTLENWQTANPVLLDGELVAVTDGKYPEVLKRGDGETAWMDLPWWPEGMRNVVDDIYNPNSTNAQSGKAVAEAVAPKADITEVDKLKGDLVDLVGEKTEEKIASAIDYTPGKFISSEGVVGTSSDLFGSYTFQGYKGQTVKAYAKVNATGLATIAIADDSEWKNIEVVKALTGSAEAWSEYTLTKDCYVICSARVSGYQPKVIIVTRGNGRVSVLEEKISELPTAENVNTLASEKTIEIISDAFLVEDNTIYNKAEGTDFVNACDLTKIENGTELSEDDGTVHEHNARMTTDFIQFDGYYGQYMRFRYVKDGSVVRINPTKVCLYDKNKNFIGIGSHAANMELIHANAKYARFTFYNNVSSETSEQSLMILFTKKNSQSIPTEYIPYNGVSETIYRETKKVVNRPIYKVVATGDSIVYGHQPLVTQYPLYANMDPYGASNYVRQSCDALGYRLVNYGISSSTCSYAKNGEDDHNALVDRYSVMDDDADLVFIQIGTNDCSTSNHKLGTFEDTTKNSFYGALKILCQGLREKYPTTPILFATPIKRWFGATGNVSVDGETIEQYANAIKEVCGYYGIPVIDMYNESGLNAWCEYDRTTWMPDGIHPDFNGHKKMAIRCTSALMQYLPQSIN